MSLAVFLHCY